MRSEGKVACFKPAISGKDIKLVGYAFVDNVNLCVTSYPSEDQTAVEKLQDALNTWEGGLRATGGAIVPEKSHWYLIDFEWTQGRWRYASQKDKPADLYVRDAWGNQQKLQCLKPSEAKRTLGVRLAPDGNNREEATSGNPTYRVLLFFLVKT